MISVTPLDLRPLSVGEILDRTFTLFRRHFVLWVGIVALPQLLALSASLTQTFLVGPGSRRPVWALEGNLVAALLGLAVVLVTYIASLFAQGATLLAVTDLYLGRPVSVADCLRRAWGEIGTVFGVGILSGAAMLAGCIVLIVGGVYVFCRLFVSLPAALVEGRGPSDALSRSWRLTEKNAGRAFVIMLLYVVIAAAAGAFFDLPLVIANIIYKHNFAMLQLWLALSQVGNTIGNIVITPILLIATSVFYFDLRVRKEGFDLQMMMDPNSERIIPPSAGPVPSILS
jgi:hypothetical protein